MNARANHPEEFGRRMPKAAPLLEPEGGGGDGSSPQGQRRDGAGPKTEAGPNAAEGASSGSTLPALRYPNIATHWQAADPGGAELMASFGGPTTCPPRRIPPRPSFTKPEPPLDETPVSPAVAAQSSLRRLRATVVLVLLVLTILLAEPMLRLLARAFVPLAKAGTRVVLVDISATPGLSRAGATIRVAG